MPTYRLEFSSPTTFYAFVDADSQSAARQCFIDGVTDWIQLGDDTPTTLDGFSEGVALLGIEAVDGEPVHATDCDLDDDCSCEAGQS